MKTGYELKEEGQARAWENEDRAWRLEARRLLRQFALTRYRFNADDFRAYAGKSGLGKPHSPNVWGSLYTYGCAEGWIRKSGDYDASANARSHAHTYAIWESMLCPPPPVHEKSADVRYELRAPGKGGMTVGSIEKAKSSKVIMLYCTYFKTSPNDIIIRRYADGEKV